MIHFEDVKGLKHALRPEDICSMSQKEKDGDYYLYREEGSPLIVDEATYTTILGYMAQDFDGYWEDKMKQFSDNLKEDAADEDQRAQYTIDLGTTDNGTSYLLTNNSTTTTPATSYRVDYIDSSGPICGRDK